MRYELTSTTKQYGSRTLYQIKALIDIPEYNVKAGDLGGFIESESNFPQDSSGWVFEQALIMGDTVIHGGWFHGGVFRGDVKLKKPLFITGLTWTISVSDDIMGIGCQSHRIDEWRGFSDKQISKMASGAAEFWGTYKAAIFTMIDDRGDL